MADRGLPAASPSSKRAATAGRQDAGTTSRDLSPSPVATDQVDRSFLAGVVEGDGYTPPLLKEFRTLAKYLTRSHLSRTKTGRASPVLGGIFVDGEDSVRFMFRGWRVADTRSLSLLDEIIQEASHRRLRVLSIEEIGRNRRPVWQASLGSADDPRNFLSDLEESDVRDAIEAISCGSDFDGSISYLQMIRCGDVRHVQVVLDAPGLASLRQRRGRLELAYSGSVTFEPAPHGAILGGPAPIGAVGGRTPARPIPRRQAVP